MNYTIIGEASTAQGKIRAYFGLGSDGVEFAAKKQMGEEPPTSMKTPVFNDLLCWIGFDELAHALYQSAQMQHKYRFQNTEILPELMVNLTKGKSLFFLKMNQEWIWTGDTDELCQIFGQQILHQIDQVMGRDFIKQHQQLWAETCAVEKLNRKSIADMKKELLAAT